MKTEKETHNVVNATRFSQGERIGAYLGAVVLAMALAGASITSAGMVLTDDFSNGTVGNSVWGDKTSDGKATRLDIYTTNALAQYGDGVGFSGSKDLNLYANGGGIAYGKYSMDLDAIGSYVANYGSFYVGGGDGYLFLAARKTINDLGYGYLFVTSGTGINVLYRAAEVDAPVSIGTMAGGVQANIALVVTTTAQQLYINGIAYDPLARATQGSGGDAVADTFNFGVVGGAAETYVGARLDDFSIVPEPASLAVCGLAALLCLRRRRAI